MRRLLPLRIASYLQVVMVIWWVILLAGCPLPLQSRPSDLGGAPTASALETLSGTVDLGAFKTQASDIGEIAAGATVGLIDSSTGHTLATTVTQPNGTFTLSFPKFRPASDRAYYLEAVKGLKAGTDLPNRVGAPIARIRTLLTYRDAGWASLTSTMASGIVLNPTTTALCIITSLRSGTAQPVTLLDLMMSLPNPTNPGSFTQVASSSITLEGLQQATDLVKSALTLDKDPVRSVLLDVSAPGYNSFILAKSPFTIGYFSPPSAAIGEEVEVVGDDFDPLPAANKVTFSGNGGLRIEVPVLAVSPDRTRLQVKVPVGTVNGPVSVQKGDVLLMSTSAFLLAARDGHSALDDQGNVYVSNYAFGTISKVTPAGLTVPLVSGLTNPRGLTVGPDNQLYVVNGNGTIYRINPAQPASANWVPYATNATGAWSLAFSPSGVLYVSLEDSNRIGKVVGGLVQTVTATGLVQPRGLCFGLSQSLPSRYVLYVANFGNDTVAVVDPDTGATSTFKSGFSRPWSVAFDTYGVMYVTNNAGNSVYSVGTDGVVRPFASVQSPGGIDAAPSGYLYVADNATNRIFRIDTAGNSTVFSEGVSSPKGLASASDGTFYIANSQNNSVIRVKPDGSVATVARGLNDPSGVALDEARNHLYVANYRSGTVTRISLTDGSFSTVLRNLALPSGVAYLKNRLYVYLADSRDGETVYTDLAEVQEYDVTQSPPAFVRNIRPPLRNNGGIARDPRAAGTVYVTQPLEGYVAKIDPATGLMSRFVTTAPDPQDVTVDANGYVYVACRGTSTSDHGIQVFAPNGLLERTITSKVDRPLSLAYDPTTQDVFFGNGADGSVGSGSIKRLSTTDRTSVTDVVASLTNPTGIAFYGTTMWLVSNGQEIRTVATYATAPAASALAITQTTALDVDVAPDGSVYVLTTGYLYKFPTGGLPRVSVTWNFMGDGARMAPNDVTGLYISNTGSTVITSTFGGTTKTLKWQGLTNSSSLTIIGPITCAITAATFGGKDYLLVPSGQSATGGGLARINLATGVSEANHVFQGGESTAPRGMAFDPVAGKAWSIGQVGAMVLRLNTGHTAIEKSTAGPDNSYIGYGATFWNGAFYATLNSHHRLERYDAVSHAKTTVPTGLGGPEI